MSAQPRPHLRLPKQESSRAYRQLWRVVDGAVFDALYNHPDYLTPKGQRAARMSINKRVVGAVLGFAEQSARGRSEQSAADRVAGRRCPLPARRDSAVSKWLAVRQGIASLFRLNQTDSEDGK